jgi:eukaryotic-like serine/threonine-protein kinase
MRGGRGAARWGKRPRRAPEQAAREGCARGRCGGSGRQPVRRKLVSAARSLVSFGDDDEGEPVRGGCVSGDLSDGLLGGRYELVDELGRGGMAVVWRAIIRRGAGFGRPVAIKKMLQALDTDQHFVALFIEEARVCTQLRHPNIVQIHDFGRDADGSHFLVMEWVDGVDLLDYVRAYRETGYHAPWAAVANVGIEVLKGLSAAHNMTDAAGNPSPIFHRDVTPHNILLGVDGAVKLSDFGLAKASDRATMTLPHVVKGKLSYTAPELTHGAPASASTDIFSLGVTLWETLAGRKLFEGSTPFEIIRRIQGWNVAPLDAARPDAPRAIVEIVHRALARDPAERFSTAEEMLEALSAVAPPRVERLGRTVADARERLRKTRPAQAEEPEDSALEALEPAAADLPVAPNAPLRGHRNTGAARAVIRVDERAAPPEHQSASGVELSVVFEPSGSFLVAPPAQPPAASAPAPPAPPPPTPPARQPRSSSRPVPQGNTSVQKAPTRTAPPSPSPPPPPSPPSSQREPSLEEISAVLEVEPPPRMPPPVPRRR